MHTLNQAIRFITLSLCIISYNAAQCMLSKFKYDPWTRQSDAIESIHRTDIERWVKFSEIGTLKPIRDIRIVRDATPEEQKERCFNYAIAQVTGTTTPLKLYKKHDKKKSTINIEKYFKQTTQQQINDIVLYTDTKNQYAINHVAIVVDKDKNIFESKFGNSTKIIQHQPFAVPTFYGDTISYWTLKPKYINNKENLRKTIRDDAEAFNNGEQSYKKQKLNDYL